jgi:hypothetical protein
VTEAGKIKYTKLCGDKQGMRGSGVFTGTIESISGMEEQKRDRQGIVTRTARLCDSEAGCKDAGPF